MKPPDPYDDILADRSSGGVSGARRLADTYKKLPAKPDIMLLHRSSGIRGTLSKFTGDLAVLRTSRGGNHTFENHPWVVRPSGRNGGAGQTAPPHPIR